MRSKLNAMRPALPCAFSCSSALTRSTVEKNRTRLPCRVMPDTPMAVARCVLPVPGPPTNTTLCASSVKLVAASVLTSLRSTGETSKSKPAMSRCTGNFAACIWWLTERMARVRFVNGYGARLLGFDLCPRLKELKQRHLFVPRGTKVPAEIAAVCEANVDVALIEKHWDSLVHLAASVMSGHASAVAALARFGSAAQGDPIYEAGVQLGRLLRTAFLADYFVKDAFRNELRRVLNRGEAVNALKRAIYTGRISPAQAKRVDEMQAVADALSLMANIVMAWNTSQMQAVLDRWSNRRQVIPPELIGKIAPTRLESINLRGVFRFPVDRYADQILPSRPNASITGTNG
jgi:hypothetical protein